MPKEEPPKTREDRLLDAAALIESIVEELDLRTRDCPHCGQGTFVNTPEARLYERLSELPKRLRNAAIALSGE